MREIGSLGNVDMPSIIKYTIQGIPDDSPCKMIIYSAQNAQEFKEKMEIYEDMLNMSLRSVKPTRTPLKKKGDYKEQLCFNCNQSGHISKNCPKDIICKYCKDSGHTVQVCPKLVEKSGAKPKTNFRNEVKLIDTTSTSRDGYYKNILIDACEMESYVDTGSDVNLMKWSVFQKLGIEEWKKEGIWMSGIGGNQKSIGSFECQIIIDEISFFQTIHIVTDETIRHQVIIGKPILNFVDISIRNNQVDFLERPEIFNINVVTNGNNADNLEHIKDPIIKEKIAELVESYRPEQRKSVNVKLSIILRDEIPVRSNPRRLSPADKITVDNQIQNWLENGIIQSSHSEYSSPIVLAKKKDGTKRLCVDYRALNSKIIRERYPLPLIEDVIDELRGYSYFSKIDLENGFFHVEVEEHCRKYTSFVVPNGQYEFLKALFGLSNCPQAFQRFVNKVFRQLMLKKVAIRYMDDFPYPGKRNLKHWKN